MTMATSKTGQCEDDFCFPAGPEALMNPRKKVDLKLIIVGALG